MTGAVATTAELPQTAAPDREQDREPRFDSGQPRQPEDDRQRCGHRHGDDRRRGQSDAGDLLDAELRPEQDDPEPEEPFGGELQARRRERPSGRAGTRPTTSPIRMAIVTSEIDRRQDGRGQARSRATIAASSPGTRRGGTNEPSGRGRRRPTAGRAAQKAGAGRTARPGTRGSSGPPRDGAAGAWSSHGQQPARVTRTRRNSSAYDSYISLRRLTARTWAGCRRRRGPRPGSPTGRTTGMRRRGTSGP